MDFEYKYLKYKQKYAKLNSRHNLKGGSRRELLPLPPAPSGYSAALSGYPAAPSGYHAAPSSYPGAPSSYPAASSGVPPHDTVAPPGGVPSDPPNQCYNILQSARTERDMVDDSQTTLRAAGVVSNETSPQQPTEMQVTDLYNIIGGDVIVLVHDIKTDIIFYPIKNVLDIISPKINQILKTIQQYNNILDTQFKKFLNNLILNFTSILNMGIDLKAKSTIDYTYSALCNIIKQIESDCNNIVNIVKNSLFNTTAPYIVQKFNKFKNYINRISTIFKKKINIKDDEYFTDFFIMGLSDMF